MRMGVRVGNSPLDMQVGRLRCPAGRQGADGGEFRPGCPANGLKSGLGHRQSVTALRRFELQYGNLGPFWMEIRL